MDDTLLEQSLKDRKFILGVTGGIAAYKTAELTRLLKKSGAEVQILMTPAATRFITPLTLGTLSEREVAIEVIPENTSGSWTKHVSFGLWADLFIIAPATAQTLAKLAHGFSDSMLTAAALAARCPLLVCPSMDRDMYAHPATQRNIRQLQSDGYEVMQAGFGQLASGLTGYGRMPEPSDIVKRVTEKLGHSRHPTIQTPFFTEKRVLITAGPTQETIDPVRFISNHSTGTMGFALAQAAASAGGKVTLVCGKTVLDTPAGVERINITTAEEMYRAVMDHADVDIVIMAAAVADYSPAEPATSKIKKGKDEFYLHLQRTRDILAALGENKRPEQMIVGFAMETENALENAHRKLVEKNIDFVVLNDLNETGAGFGTQTNRVTIIARDGSEKVLPLMSKRDTAVVILNHISEAWNSSLAG